MALRVGYEKLQPRDRLGAAGLVGGGRAADDRWYAENRERWIGRVDWLPTGAPTPTRERVLVTGGGGFLGSHLVERLEARRARRRRRAARATTT